MPIPVNEVPKTLRPYLFHGLDLGWRGKEQATCDCPWCGREGKFVVKVETGEWRCYVCAEGSEKGGGNVYTFLRLLHDKSDAATNGQSKALAAERRLLHAETVTYWRVVQSILTKRWLVPGYGVDGKLNQLYKYEQGPDGRMVLKATAGLHHQLHGMNLWDPRKREIYLCEGPWDAMALWEVLRSAKPDEGGGYALTANEDRSLLARANVIAVPGCSTFVEGWLPLFNGRVVHLLYDSDHPREKAGSAGWEGMKRVAKLLAAHQQPPKEIHCVHWGEKGYDPGLQSGADVRDVLSVGGDVHGRIAALAGLLERVKPIPADWVAGRTKTAAKTGGTEIETVPCSRWSDLVNAWRKAMKWPEPGKGLDHALAAMLASVVSVEAIGDQLWLKIIGPPSCGKSTIAEGLIVARKFVKPVSQLTGMTSGYRETKDAGEDNSLVSLLYNMTMIITDGDTLLKSPNLPQILAQLRQIYDRNIRTQYRTKASKDYDNLNLTVIICGTKDLKKLDSSELGERFLDVKVMDLIDDEHEDEIAWRVANRVKRNLTKPKEDQSLNLDDPLTLRAKQMTGGYVEHLRRNADELIAGVDMDEATTRQCMALAKFVAYMRAQPSKVPGATPQRELSGRLVSQLIRLAYCLAVVLCKRVVDDEVMTRVWQVSLDTSAGPTLDLAKKMHELGREGACAGALAIYTSQTDADCVRQLWFLRSIGAVETFAPISRITKKPLRETRYRLTSRVHAVYGDVMGTSEPIR